MAPTTPTTHKYTLSPSAHLRLHLHSFKYSTTPVIGLLIGTPPSPSQSSTVEITHALPLFHTAPLLPSLDIAFNLVDTYLSNKNLSIVGVYAGNTAKNDTTPSTVVKRIADRVEQVLGGGAVIVMIDAVGFGTKPNAGGVIPYVSASTSSWSGLARAQFEAPSAANGQLKNAVAERQYERVIDFDEHLDDVSLNWIGSNLRD
ncbi:hypothetical protein BC832DRAFT_319678 [Gaertneriomyces semiglobifer]|nr:hypothetical protein BC832DRAFT_319678 [Gaertneriomyces semiglobifer]